MVIVAGRPPGNPGKAKTTCGVHRIGESVAQA
jgi:hypothetical protein